MRSSQYCEARRHRARTLEQMLGSAERSMWLLPLLLGLVGALGLLVSSTLLAEVHLPNASNAPGLESPSENTLDSPVRKVALDIPADSYFDEPEGTGLLKYQVSCAPGAGTHAQLELPDPRSTLAGNVGLAPDSAERAMTLAEQCWCSFPILLRTSVKA